MKLLKSLIKSEYFEYLFLMFIVFVNVTIFYVIIAYANNKIDIGIIVCMIMFVILFLLFMLTKKYYKFLEKEGHDVVVIRNDTNQRRNRNN